MRFVLSFRKWAGGAIVAMAVLLALAEGRAQLPAATPTNRSDGTKSAHPLVWDAMEKTLTPKLGEEILPFQFSVTNSSEKSVTIEQIRPTCGCTVAEMPSSPWVLEPGANGTFVGTIDVRGKEGTISKALFVNSTAGTQMLGITVKIPTLDDEARKRNQLLAQADRQAIFRGDCAICHVKPTVGRTGGELFTAACGVCHLSEHRASMVPDLLVAKEHRDAAYWRKWITEGKEGTLMPAWAQDHGGPLTREQIESLIQFAMAALPVDPVSAPAEQKTSTRP
jgi:hypothetical protein